MAIRIDPNQEVKFEVSYLQPTFTVSYVDVQVSAAVTFPDVLSVDVVTPTDLVTLATTKALADVYSGFADKLVRAFVKGRADSVTMTDDIDIDFFLQKLLQDAQSLADNDIFSFSKKLVDTAIPADNLAKATQKALADVYSGFLDTTTIAFDKAAADSVVMFDDTDIDYWIEKSLGDLQSIADAQAIDFSKFLADAYSIADLASLDYVKSLADSINTPTEAVARAFEKSLSDSVTLTDAAQAFKLYIRAFADSVTSPDASFFDFTPTDPLDGAATSDQSTIASDKNLSESLNLLDNMDGDIEYVFIKLVSELLVTSDAQAVDFALNKSDNTVLSSSGVLSMQDYCDITYFLEDYVGTSRTFT